MWCSTRSAAKARSGTLYLGDLHHRDVVTNDEAALHKAYVTRSASGPRYARLLGELPVPYIWSDQRSSAGPNGDRTSAALPGHGERGLPQGRVASP